MQYFGFDRPSFAFKTFGFGANFDPMTLFAGGKQGVWYDPSDKSTLFQDVAGTVLVTKDGDPVGLMLDKSQGLEGAVTNVAKPFMADSSNSLIEVTNTSDGTKLVIKQLSTESQINIFEVDKTYKLSVVYSVPETASNINAYNTTSGVSNFLFTATKGVRNKAEVTLTAKSTALYFRASVGEITIHEIVLKEIKGNHATQSLSVARPVYKTVNAMAWLYNDKIDDKMLVRLPTMTATVIKATDEGVSINYPVSITAGDYPITSTSALGRDYGHLIINKELSASEITQVTNYFNAKRGV